MSKQSSVLRHGCSQGQIPLGRALFCVGCEIIFTGTACCPRCTSSDSVWPLSEWLRSVRSTTVAMLAEEPCIDTMLPTRQQHKRSAA